MKGLLTKEWCVIKKNSILSFLVILIFAVAGVLADASYMLAYAPLFLGMIPINYMVFDETSRWQQYSLSMPYKRSSVVSAKYVITLIFALISTIVMAVGLYLNMKLHGKFQPEAFGAQLIIAPVVGIVLPSLTYPFNFRFGTSKGRLVMLFLVCGLAALMSIFVATTLNIVEVSISGFITKFDIYQIACIILAAVAVICAVSWIISIKIFEKKDM